MTKVEEEDDPINTSVFSLVQKLKPGIIELVSNKTYSTGEPLYSEDNKTVVLELLGIVYQKVLISKDPKSAIQDMTKFLDRDFKDEEDFFFSLPEMEESVKAYEMFVQSRKQKLDVGEGIYECSKCGSKSTSSVQKKTRSSDEPMVTSIRCNDCGKNWVIGG